MIGTIINVIAIILGGALGLVFGSRFPARFREMIVTALGLFVLVIGMQMAFKTQQALVVLGGLLLGGLLGEWLRIEDRLKGLGAWLERRFNEVLEKRARRSNRPVQEDPDVSTLELRSARFIRGFLTASLVFAIGPLAILGSIQDGLTGDYNLLAIKSVMDGFAALAFSASLGIGVLFSSLVILVYQGSISLLAAQAQAIMTPAMLAELTGTGGILLVGLSISNLLEIKPIRVANFLPALLISPLIVAILAAISK